MSKRLILCSLIAFSLPAFADTYVQPLKPGCTVQSIAQVSVDPDKTSLTVKCDSGPPPPCSQPITVPSATQGIANYTRMTGIQNVNYFGAGYKAVDITSFDSVYWKAWPGNGTLTAALQVPNNKYVSEKFHVPTDYMAGYSGPGLWGNYSNAQTGYSAPVSFTISTCPGDFSNPAINGSTVVEGCWANAKTAGGFVQWRNDVTCELKDNTDYYLNYGNFSINAVLPNGAGSAASTKNGQCNGSCSDSIRNGPGSWGQYTPPQ